MKGGYPTKSGMKQRDNRSAFLLPWMKPFFVEEFKRTLTVSLVRQKVAAVQVAIQKHTVQNRSIEDM